MCLRDVQIPLYYTCNSWKVSCVVFCTCVFSDGILNILLLLRHSLALLFEMVVCIITRHTPQQISCITPILYSNITELPYLIMHDYGGSINWCAREHLWRNNLLSGIPEKNVPCVLWDETRMACPLACTRVCAGCMHNWLFCGPSPCWGGINLEVFIKAN